MYTRRIFPVKVVIKWTRRRLFLFIILATVPVILFDIVGLKWLHVPWLPLGVLGTAVAFLVSFKIMLLTTGFGRHVKFGVVLLMPRVLGPYRLRILLLMIMLRRSFPKLNFMAFTKN